VVDVATERDTVTRVRAEPVDAEAAEPMLVRVLQWREAGLRLPPSL
jgi:hypothetical protein